MFNDRAGRLVVRAFFCLKEGSPSCQTYTWTGDVFQFDPKETQAALQPYGRSVWA